MDRKLNLSVLFRSTSCRFDPRTIEMRVTSLSGETRLWGESTVVLTTSNIEYCTRWRYLYMYLCISVYIFRYSYSCPRNWTQATDSIPQSTFVVSIYSYWCDVRKFFCCCTIQCVDDTTALTILNLVKDQRLGYWCHQHNEISSQRSFPSPSLSLYLFLIGCPICYFCICKRGWLFLLIHTHIDRDTDSRL